MTGELGFDACIDYKREDVAARLKELAPGGVDIFFDNVGGELLDTVLRRLAMRARVVLCGDISTYQLDGPPPPLHNVRYLMGKRARMEGFNTLDHWDVYQEAATRLAGWVASGDVVARTHVLEGLERAPEALVRLFAGDHARGPTDWKCGITSAAKRSIAVTTQPVCARQSRSRSNFSASTAIRKRSRRSRTLSPLLLGTNHFARARPSRSLMRKMPQQPQLPRCKKKID